MNVKISQKYDNVYHIKKNYTLKSIYNDENECIHYKLSKTYLPSLYFRFVLFSLNNLSLLPNFLITQFLDFSILSSSFISSFSFLYSIIHFSIFFSLFLIEYKSIYL